LKINSINGRKEGEFLQAACALREHLRLHLYCVICISNAIHSVTEGGNGKMSRKASTAISTIGLFALKASLH